MAGSCALCLRSIVDGERFVVAGTEVFHRACVATRGTQQSIGNRRHARLVELEGLSRQQAIEIARQRDEAKRHASIAEEDLERSRQSVREMSALICDLTRQRDEYRAQRDAARRERDEATAARDAARRDLALIQQLSQGQAHGAQTQADPSTQEDGKDATEKRFSLLELD